MNQWLQKHVKSTPKMFLTRNKYAQKQKFLFYTQSWCKVVRRTITSYNKYFLTYFPNKLKPSIHNQRYTKLGYNACKCFHSFSSIGCIIPPSVKPFTGHLIDPSVNCFTCYLLGNVMLIHMYNLWCCSYTNYDVVLFGFVLICSQEDHTPQQYLDDTSVAIKIFHLVPK